MIFFYRNNVLILDKRNSSIKKSLITFFIGNKISQLNSITKMQTILYPCSYSDKIWKFNVDRALLYQTQIEESTRWQNICFFDSSVVWFSLVNPTDVFMKSKRKKKKVQSLFFAALCKAGELLYFGIKWKNQYAMPILDVTEFIYGGSVHVRQKVSRWKIECVCAFFRFLR